MSSQRQNTAANNPQSGNIFKYIAEVLPTETFETLFQNRALRIERIISKGHITPENEWYDQDWDEWVLLVKGRAALLFEDCLEAMELEAGDYVFIAAHRKHRVTWTDPQQTSIWLAIHVAPEKIAGNG